MPPKSSLTADAAPRRSTRRTKRPADTDLEEDEPAAPTKQPKKAAASKSQRGAPGQKQSGKHARGRKGKAHDDGPPDDTPASASKASKTSKTAKNTKADKPQADQQSKSAVKDAKQEQGSPSAESTLSTQAANKPTAASKSGQPGPSDEQQLAAAADTACPKAHSTTVAGDADVMLNQTNIGANNNKFYRMQLLQEGPSDHWLWTRWGRVGDKGQSQLQGPFDADTGLKEFEKKFKYALHQFFLLSTDLCLGQGACCRVSASIRVLVCRQSTAYRMHSCCMTQHGSKQSYPTVHGISWLYCQPGLQLVAPVSMQNMHGHLLAITLHDRS